MNHFAESELQRPACEDCEQADGGDEGEGTQDEMDDDAALDFDLLAPACVEGCELLLSSEAIAEDAEDVLFDGFLLEVVDGIGG